MHVHAGDLAKLDAEKSVDAWAAELNGLDVVLLAYGLLGEQRELERDLKGAAALIDTNFRSAALWSLAVANRLEAAKHGTLVVIGSVAGDRGRQSNYLYGATKAGLGVLVQGIAHRLAPSGARAVLVKPGFVDTAMTAHIEKKGALWSSPEKLAVLIRKAAEKRQAHRLCARLLVGDHERDQERSGGHLPPHQTLTRMQLTCPRTRRSR